MGAPLAIGDQVIVTLGGRLSGQEVQTVLRYVVSAPGTAPDLLTGLFEIAHFFADNGSGAPLATRLRDAQSVSLTYEYVRAQRVYPTRSIYAEDTPVHSTGNFLYPCNNPNLAAVITKRSELPGRKGVGAIHVPGIADLSIVAGLLSGIQIPPLHLVADQCHTTQVTAVYAIELDMITHLGATGGLSEVVLAELQPEVRTMHRRTVGLGI